MGIICCIILMNCTINCMEKVIFNDEGDLIEWTDSVYHKEVENRKSNPFTSLYAGFEFERADYKKRA